MSKLRLKYREFTGFHISVISNSRLTSLSRALSLAENFWDIKVTAALYSSLPLRDLVLPQRYIKSFYKLPQQLGAHGYDAVALDCTFQKSISCLLFFNKLVPEIIFNTVPTINFHPSLLPQYPGLSGYNSAIAAEQLAVTAHTVDTSIDGGGILRQYSVEPFPRRLAKEELKNESSLLCSAAILSILRTLPTLAVRHHEQFSSSTACVDTVLSEGRSF